MTATLTAAITIPSEASFGDNDYLHASDLEHLAARLIGRTPGFAHIGDVRLAVLWKRKGGSSRGQARYGQCKRVAGLEKHYSEEDFIIWLAADHLRGQPQRMVEGTLYHELLHIGTHPDTGEAMLVGHDTEMFVGEVQEYGLWRPELEYAHAAFTQLPLLPDEA